MEVLEHVQERPGAGERPDDVEDDEIHPTLQLLGLRRRLLGALEVEELREHGARDRGIREAELVQLRGEAFARVGGRGVDLELNEEGLDEAGVAALVHA